MLDFDRWFAAQGQESAKSEQLLPEGVHEEAAGAYWARCRSCGCAYELLYDPAEFTEEGNYCGGSHRCLP